MLIKDALDFGSFQLISSSSPRLDAEVLLCHVLNKEIPYLIAHDKDEIGFWDLWKYKRLIQKRKRGVPIAYLMGKKEFFGLELEVNKSVLVPRQDTEILADCVIEYFKEHETQDTEGSFVLLDVGTGSGCIPIAFQNKFYIDKQSTLRIVSIAKQQN